MTWQYRNKHALCFDLESQVKDVDLDFEELCGVVMLSTFKNGEILEAYRDSLQHGDVIDFNSYRGVGMYIVEPVDAEKSDFYCWKTIEEMGYGVPPCFGDAPAGYYQKHDLFYIWKSTDFVTADDPLWDEVEAWKEDPNKEMTAQWQSKIIPAEFPDNYLWFEDNLEGGTSWIAFKAFASQMYFETSVWDVWKERWAVRYPNRQKSARSNSSVTTVQAEQETANESNVDSEETSPKVTGKRSGTSKQKSNPPAKRQRLPRKVKRKAKGESDDDDWEP